MKAVAVTRWVIQLTILSFADNLHKLEAGRNEPAIHPHFGHVENRGFGFAGRCPASPCRVLLSVQPIDQLVVRRDRCEENWVSPYSPMQVSVHVARYQRGRIPIWPRWRRHERGSV